MRDTGNEVGFHSENASNVFDRLYADRNLKMHQSPIILDLCLRKLGQGNIMIIVTFFSKSFILIKCFPFTQGRRFQTPPGGLKSVFEKLRFS